MLVSDCLSVNENGHLTIGGTDTVELAARYGTPLYVMDEDTIRKNCREFKNSIDEFYDGNGLCIYASKSMCCKKMCRIIAEEGLGLDVVSGGELYTAIKSNFPMERVFFHGNNKTEDELRLALDNKVGRIVVDNLTELQLLATLAKEYGRAVNIMMRIKPGVDAHTHDYIRTGQIDSKFGFALETGEAFEAVKTAAANDYVNLVGLHCHIGSQIFELEPFELAATTMMEFIIKIRHELHVNITELDIGGGFGIMYTEQDSPKQYRDFMKTVANAVKELCKQHNIPVPKIMIEPGRSIAGPAGITLYTVGTVKTIPNVRSYVSVDGGMCDNPRYILYKAPYEVVVANKANEERDFVATIAGKCCESGDLIQENTKIQSVSSGDIIAVLATGAYNYSMASNYNRIPRPPVVMIKDGEPRVIVKGESYDDIIKNDV